LITQWIAAQSIVAADIEIRVKVEIVANIDVERGKEQPFVGNLIVIASADAKARIRRRPVIDASG
jgi:hypothetical protein